MTTITIEINNSEYKRLKEESDETPYFFPEHCKRLLRLSHYISKEDMKKYNKLLEKDKDLWCR